jgi:hypothetical protein
MASVSNPTSRLSFLTQPGGLLNSLPAGLSASKLESALQSAPPQDIVQLSEAALASQQADGLFGASQQTQTNLPLELLSSGSTASQVLPGVSPADLSNATPQQQNAITLRRCSCN